jgi:cytoskeletal protein CcmA (bactofilin family)
VTLYSHSKIEGDVYYQALEIKRGARINGRLIALSDSSSTSGSGLLGKLKLKNASSQTQSA